MWEALKVIFFFCLIGAGTVRLFCSHSSHQIPVKLEKGIHKTTNLEFLKIIGHFGNKRTKKTTTKTIFVTLTFIPKDIVNKEKQNVFEYIMVFSYFIHKKCHAYLTNILTYCYHKELNKSRCRQWSVMRCSFQLFHFVDITH